MRWLAVLALAACNEYDIQGGDDLFGEPNPPNLAAPLHTDRVVQLTVPAVDVLWVVDDSGSMSEEQGALIGNFRDFIQFFVGSDLDWHLGVVSTDMDTPSLSGRLVSANGLRYLDANSPDPVGTFADMATLGTGGNSDEQGIGAAWSALVTLRNSAENQGFYRDDAHLAVIVVSDENDHTPFATVSQTEFTQWMMNHKPAEDMTSFSSIIGGPGGCTSDWGDAEYGQRYYDATENIGGIYWSICDSDWTELFEQLGMSAVGLKREFFLSEVPVESTLRVWVRHDGVDSPYSSGTDWTYSRTRNSVTFLSVTPPPLAEVMMEYELLGSYHEQTSDAP